MGFKTRIFTTSEAVNKVLRAILVALPDSKSYKNLNWKFN